MTYSSRSYLERKTGAFGVGRFKYLQALVTEFQDSHQQGKTVSLCETTNVKLQKVEVASYFTTLNSH